MIFTMDVADTTRGVIAPSATVRTNEMSSISVAMGIMAICFIIAERANGMGAIKYIFVLANLKIALIREGVSLVTSIVMTSTTGLSRSMLNTIIVHCRRNGHGTSNDTKSNGKKNQADYFPC